MFEAYLDEEGEDEEEEPHAEEATDDEDEEPYAEGEAEDEAEEDDDDAEELEEDIEPIEPVIAWMFTVPYLIRALDRRPQQRGGARPRGSASSRRGRVFAARYRSPPPSRSRSRPMRAPRSPIAT